MSANYVLYQVYPIDFAGHLERGAVRRCMDQATFEWSIFGVGLYLSWHTLALAISTRPLQDHGIVACEAEEKKRLKCSNLSATNCFIPVAVETLGALGADPTDFIRQLGLHSLERVGLTLPDRA